MVVTKTPGATSTHGVNFGLPATKTSIQPVKSTNVAFDTGATGSIIMNDAILANVSNCRVTEYRGLNGSLMVSKVGQLGDIGVVHYDPRAKLSILRLLAPRPPMGVQSWKSHRQRCFLTPHSRIHLQIQTQRWPLHLQYGNQAGSPDISERRQADSQVPT
jgi:hypothetical protein